MTDITLRTARFPSDQPAVLEIFREYVKSPKQDLSYQNFEAEFALQPGDYAEPAGRILLAWHKGNVVGCAAIRKVDHSTCELKRVYVRPVARGLNIGRLLVEQLITEATLIGYSRMCLDVLPEFLAAQKLYESLGFLPANPVSYNPVPGTKFLALEL
jgi:GNAT superfamily N-acetyltransferase